MNKDSAIKSIALATLIVILLSGIVFQYYITALPDLEQPITLGSASVSSDGGSISAAFVDKDGYEFHFGVQGDADSDRASFTLFYIRNPKLVPYLYWPSTGGPDERKFLRLLGGWIQRNLAPELREKLEQNDLESFSGPEMEVAAVYEIYEILMSRHRL
ncbi:hypothetical protein [Marinobacter sediminum]|uniref:hypothetical protein n=1 Tax=Marinobacter sediminum TaxID=256323 RepID=UPI00193AD1E7|nr:hypothetical protein [Marinobacter sediminum]